MTPEDRVEVVLVLLLLGELGPLSVPASRLALPRLRRRHTEARLLMAQREGWAVRARVEGQLVYCLTPAGVVMLDQETHAADAAE